MSTVSVLFFATLRDRAGVKSLNLDLPWGSTVADFRRILTLQIPALKAPLETSLISVNQEFALDDIVIPQGAELAVFPPVSGG